MLISQYPEGYLEAQAKKEEEKKKQEKEKDQDKETGKGKGKGKRKRDEGLLNNSIILPLNSMIRLSTLYAS